MECEEKEMIGWFGKAKGNILIYLTEQFNPIIICVCMWDFFYYSNAHTQTQIACFEIDSN